MNTQLTTSVNRTVDNGLFNTILNYTVAFLSNTPSCFHFGLISIIWNFYCSYWILAPKVTWFMNHCTILNWWLVYYPLYCVLLALYCCHRYRVPMVTVFSPLVYFTIRWLQESWENRIGSIQSFSCFQISLCQQSFTGSVRSPCRRKPNGHQWT